MLNQQDSDILTQVGPGTPLGEMMRRYWHPAALSDQVEADGAPLRTKLLGQPLVVFRDTEGRAGVMNEFCMHRGASLALGRNEEGGIRCLFHGWKFAVDGTILETPNHSDCRFRERLKAPAYPVREQSGIIWTYLGPKELEPPFRSFEYDTVPEGNRFVFRANVKANWLPMWEGGLDSSHVAILHTNAVRPGWAAKQRGEVDVDSNAWDELAPKLELEDTEFGYHYCAFREVPGTNGTKRHARAVPAMMPNMRIIPSQNLSFFAIEVPLDDHETAGYVVMYRHGEPFGEAELENLKQATTPYGSPLYDRETRNLNIDWCNNMGQDRSTMKENWTGINAIALEDYALSVTLNYGWDRENEHLVTSDLAVVRMRRMVMDAIRTVQEGGDPPAVNRADMTRVIGYDRTIDESEDWQSLAPGNIERTEFEQA